MAFKSYYKLVKYKDPAERHLPFYVEDVSGQNSTLTVKSWNGDATNVEYSTDGQTWSSTNPNLSANGRVYIRANATTWSTYSGFNGGIDVTNNFNVGGNIMSLLYGSNFTGTETVFPDMTKMYIFNGFFYNTKVTSAEKLALPATTLANNCYRGMFYNCTSLTKTPETLPATTLDVGCYQQMFLGCTSLTTAPSLPATTLTNYCYSSMFNGCTSLTQAPALPATTLKEGCYYQMFDGCTSLTTSPVLHGGVMQSYSYYSMFRGCSSLNSITVEATSWNTANSSNWVNGVSATGTFTKPSATNIAEGTSGIPSGWTVVNV